MKILMLGTKAPGGMDALVELYLRSKINEAYPIRYIPTHIETNSIFKMIYFAWSLARAIPYMLMPQYRIAHMHVSTGGSLPRKYLFAMLAKMCGMKVIYHMHGGDFFEMHKRASQKKKRFIHRMLKLADRIIVLSNIRKKQYSGITEPSKLEVIYNFTPAPDITQRKHNGLNIVFIGRLGKVKGTDELIAAAEKNRNMGFRLQIWGDGPEERYKKIVKNLGLTKKVEVKGWLDPSKIDEVLSVADIYVQPSHFEDLPISIIRALSHSLPVVSTPVGGIPEQVKDGYNGFLVKPGDVDMLAEALKTLISDNKTRKLFGRRGLGIYRSRFSQEKIEAQVISLYGELADED